MDTKWKNIENVWKKLPNGKIRGVISLVCGVLGVWLLFYIFQEYHHLLSQEVWIIGGGANLLLSIVFGYGISYEMNKRYQKWDFVAANFYQEWRQEYKKQQKIIVLCAIAAEVPALLFFKSILGYWYGNYSAGYVMVGTVLIQFMVTEYVVMRYMRRLLDQHMGEQERILEKNMREAMEQAVRSEKMKVDLISNVSHDLKTPLTSMVGYIELIKKEELSDVVTDYVEVLSNKAQKLKEMIESLFELAKTSSGNIELNMEQIELNRLITQVQADMEDRFEKAGREVVMELTEEETELLSDSSYMYRICQNLIENALKYSAESTRIYIKTARIEQNGKERVRFEITNTANYRMNFTNEQIVERFSRGDEARTTDGNGLGLAIVSTFTSALGGIFGVNIDCDQFKASVEFPI